jgi:hypothetical protein
MSRCSVCGRNVSNKTAHFGLGCLKNMCSLIDMEKPKNLKGENLLNTRIAKITNKKLLSKDEKYLLTNRYLTLQLLNKVPLNYYDNARKQVSSDIENIGNNKRKSSETIVTLKQAYEIYKLYNKFQKIKNKSEEVDSEYIQNFLFDNLLFAFSTYYRNKKYLGGVIADIQYYFWKSVIIWKKDKYPSGTEFINYSLQEKPEDRLITDGKIIEDIIEDPKFIEKINQIIKTNDNKKRFDITEGLDYVSTDLFLALNNTTINVIGNKEDKNWKLNITITDRYDFTDFKEIDEYCDDDIIKGLLGSTANNMAMVSVASGVMHEYNVTIKFDIDKWEVQ